MAVNNINNSKTKKENPEEVGIIYILRWDNLKYLALDDFEDSLRLILSANDTFNPSIPVIN